MKNKIDRIKSFLRTDFEIELFKASVAYIDNTGDPLRFNSFSASLRELSRHLLSRLAPDEEVRKCSWFKVETDNGAPTRKQRIIYAIQGGLSTRFIEDELYIDASDEIKDSISSINLLSKFTHVNEETFNISQSKCVAQAESVLDSFVQIFEIIAQAREEIKASVHDYITDELMGIFISNTFDDLDILSSQTIPESSALEEFEIEDINSDKILMSGYGNVEVSLNYGKGDDGTEINDSFPYDFKCYSEITSPKDIIIGKNDIQVDTSSWYE
jgi:hypothetical protein